MKNMEQEVFKDMLRKKGLKVTNQRMLVLEIMAERPGEHLTAEDIYDLAKKKCPDIVSRGFVYVRESEDLMEDARAVVNDAVLDCLDRHVNDWGKIKNIIRDSLSDFLWKRMKRNPMILPIIMEV